MQMRQELHTYAAINDTDYIIKQPTIRNSDLPTELIWLASGMRRHHMTTLTVLMGISGSGKSTWAASQPEHTVTIDAIRRGADPTTTSEAARSHAIAKLKAGHDIIFDACHLLARRRRPWLPIAAQICADTRLVIVHPPDLATLMRRQSDRHKRATPPAVVARQLRDWPRDVARARKEPWTEIVDVMGEACK